MKLAFLITILSDSEALSGSIAPGAFLLSSRGYRQRSLSVSIVLPSHCRLGASWEDQLLRCEADVKLRSQSQ